MHTDFIVVFRQVKTETYWIVCLYPVTDRARVWSFQYGRHPDGSVPFSAGCWNGKMLAPSLKQELEQEGLTFEVRKSLKDVYITLGKEVVSVHPQTEAAKDHYSSLYRKDADGSIPFSRGFYDHGMLESCIKGLGLTFEVEGT